MVVLLGCFGAGHKSLEGPEAALGCLDLGVFACGSWGAGRPARGPWGAGSASHASRVPGSPSRGARSLRVVLPVWVLTARPAGPSHTAVNAPAPHKNYS